MRFLARCHDLEDVAAINFYLQEVPMQRIKTSVFTVVMVNSYWM